MRLVCVCTCVRVRPNNFKTWVGKHSNRKLLGRVWEKRRNPKVQTSRESTPPVNCLRRRRRPAGRAATHPTQGNDSFQWGQPAATCKWPGGCGRSHSWKNSGRGAGRRLTHGLAPIGSHRDGAGSPEGPASPRGGAWAWASWRGKEREAELRVGKLRSAEPSAPKGRAGSATVWPTSPSVFEGVALFLPTLSASPSAPSSGGRSPQPGRGGAARAPGPGRSAISRVHHGAHCAVPHRGGPDWSEEGRE